MVEMLTSPHPRYRSAQTRKMGRWGVMGFYPRNINQREHLEVFCEDTEHHPKFLIISNNFSGCLFERREKSKGTMIRML